MARRGSGYGSTLRSLARVFAVLALAITSLPLVTPGEAWGQGRASRAMRSLELQPTAGGWQLELRLEYAVRYLRHSPALKGKLLRILVDPIDIGDRDREDLTLLREILPLPPLRGAPIVEVAYEAISPDGPTIELQFTRPVSYEVEQGSDFQTIQILIFEGPRPEPDAAGPIEVEVEGAVDDDSKSFELLTRAKRALRDRDLDLALLLLTKILATDPAEMGEGTRREAKELLGLTHERRGEEAHARAEYESFLAEYPDAPGADRVRQRLETLVTAAAAPRASLKTAKTEARTGRGAKERTLDIDTFGSLGVTYFRSESMFEDDDFGFIASDILTDLVLSNRIRDEGWEVGTDFAGTYDADVAGEGRSNDLRISRLTVGFEDRERGYEVTVGRQRRSDSGVLGRFDGVRGVYRFASHYSVAGLVGLPVTSTSDSTPDTDTILAGVALDVEDLWLKGLRGQLFVVGQNSHGMTDRTAVGGDIRYVHPKSYSFLYLDYDVYFNSLNTVIASSTYYLNTDTDFRILVDRRNSPVLTLATALQGQLVSDLDDLSDLFSDSQIRRLATERTQVIWTGTIGATHRPSRKLQISGDLGFAYAEGTDLPISEGGVDSVGPDFNTSLQFLVNDWLVEGGVGSVSVRYFEGDSSRGAGTSLFSRFLLFKGFRISPRMRWDWRDSDFQGNTTTLRPSLEADWRISSFLLNTEVGFRWIDSLPGGTVERETSYFVEVGARWEF